jgi:hypothetical protein
MKKSTISANLISVTVAATLFLSIGQAVADTNSSVPANLQSVSNPQVNQTPTANINNWASGIVNGVLAQSGSAPENWQSGQFIMQPLTHDISSNQLAISGQAPNDYTGDIIIDIVTQDAHDNPNTPLDWAYTLPAENGNFSGTVVVPYNGISEVYVGIPAISTTLSIQPGFASTSITNQQLELTAPKWDCSRAGP